MLQYALINRFGGLLRWYRTRLLLDLPRLRRSLPSKGVVLDVGCGVGSLDYVLAKDHPELQVSGIDITPASVELAHRHHALPNVTYQCRRIEDMTGEFDCVMFVDVFHHVPPEFRNSLLGAAARLLKPDGYVLIKDISRRGGWVSWCLDRFVSGCPANEIFLANGEELSEVVARHLKVVSLEKHYRFPFPRYYIKAMRKPDAGNA